MASGVLTKFGLVANHEIEATVAFQNLRRGDAADGSLHGGVDDRRPSVRNGRWQRD